MTPNLNGQLIYDKGGKTASSVNGVGRTRQPHAEEPPRALIPPTATESKEPHRALLPPTAIDSKQTKDLNARPEPMRLLKENIGRRSLTSVLVIYIYVYGNILICLLRQGKET